jgi:hypothetical protein
MITFEKFPIPNGYALVCPHCNYWKMYEVKGNKDLFKCAGKSEVPEGYDVKRYITCGKVTSRLEVELYILVR